MTTIWLADGSIDNEKQPPPHDKSANVFLPPEASNLNHTAAVNDCCAGSRVALSGSGEARNALDEKRRAALGVPKRSGTQLRPGSVLEEKTLYVSALSKEKKKVVSAGPSADDGMHVRPSPTAVAPLVQLPHADEPGMR